MTNHILDSKLEKYIATRDRRMKDPVSMTPLLNQFNELILRRKVEVGGRASCGSSVDPTWLFFTAWNEIMRKAQTLGYEIAIAPVKHANGSPTRAGGFWNSNVYQLTSIPGSCSTNGSAIHPVAQAPEAHLDRQRSSACFDDCTLGT